MRSTKKQHMNKMVGSLLLPVLFLLQMSVAMAGVLQVTVKPGDDDAGTAGIGIFSDKLLYITLANTGTTDLRIENVIADNIEFTVLQPTQLQVPRLILAGQTLLVSADFAPLTPGARTGNIIITSDDAVSPVVTIPVTGYGGVEQTITFAPNMFEIEENQGMYFRANVIFDNGVEGVARITWTSSNPAVATILETRPDTDFGAGFVAPTALLTTVGLGDTTITAVGMQNASATASTTARVVPTSPFEFVASSLQDQLIWVKDSVPTVCYDFPEVDPVGDPLFDVSQIGVTTSAVGVSQIGDIFITAEDISVGGENIFYLDYADSMTGNCTNINYPARSLVFDKPLTAASFRDLKVRSDNTAIVADISQSLLYEVSSTGSILYPMTGLPVDDVGTLAVDGEDNIYLGSMIETFDGNGVLADRQAAVYVQPFLMPGTWMPVAAVFNTLTPGSFSLPAMAAIKVDNQGYAMKLVDFDQVIIERYIDMNGDFNMFNIVGTTILPDPGEILEVANVIGAVDVNVDPDRNLIVSVSEPVGRRVERFTDKNGDRDYNDPFERRILYQSNLAIIIRDLAYTTPCQEAPPVSRISVLPPSKTAELGDPFFLLGGGSFDPCGSALTYIWRDEAGTVMSNNFTVADSKTGLPDTYTYSLEIIDSVGLTNTSSVNIAVGPPHVNGFWPSEIGPGGIVFLFGDNFVTTNGGFPTACFGAICTPLTQLLANDLMLAIVPAGVTVPTSIPLSVKTDVATGVSLTNWGSVPPGVGINGIWPATASAGKIIFVFGSGFDPVVGNTQVTINGVPNFLTQVQDATLLLTIVPAGATTGPICVTVAGNTACSALDLTVVP